MAVNANRPERWKADIQESVDFFNRWFLQFAPSTFRTERNRATGQVEEALAITRNFTNVVPAVLLDSPGILPFLRMGTAPPIARDRLIGLAGVSKNLVLVMEKDQQLPKRMSRHRLIEELGKISETILQLADRDIFTWLDNDRSPEVEEVHRAATVVADRLTGAASNPIIRNAQEQRQLATMKRWLEQRGYQEILSGEGGTFDRMVPGTFSFRLNVPVRNPDTGLRTNLPVDAVIQPNQASPGEFPLLVEAKSAGDFTNVNKRRKEEAQKFTQLKQTYGPNVVFILFLCGYFDSGYLGYEAAEGIDWVWEHRVSDLAEFGI